MTSFLFILLSAFMHSLWNVVLKKSKEKYAFNFLMHVFGVIYFSFIYVVFFPEYLYFDGNSVFYAFVAAIFFTMYHLFVTTAYRYSDVSQVYPVTTASPLFILLWAVLFLGESVSLLGVTGILVTILGTIVINYTGGVRKGVQVGVIYAFLGAFAYSFGALQDKAGVVKTNFILYVYCMTVFMTVFMYLYARRTPISFRTYFKEEWKLVVIGGLVLFLSFITYRWGLRGMEISYAAALRQVNAFFGTVAGILFFKEPFGRYRIWGTVIIIAGVVMIRFGM